MASQHSSDLGHALSLPPEEKCLSSSTPANNIHNSPSGLPSNSRFSFSVPTFKCSEVVTFMLSYITKTYIDGIDFKNCIQTSSCSQIPLCHQFIVLLVEVNCFLLLGQKDTVLKHFLPLKE